MRIVWYLERHNGITLSDAGIYRSLCRNGLNRVPRGTRARKALPSATTGRGRGITFRKGAKILIFNEKAGHKVRRFQSTAINDATRVRPLKIHERHNQADAIDFLDHVISTFRFRIRKIRTRFRRSL